MYNIFKGTSSITVKRSLTLNPPDILAPLIWVSISQSKYDSNNTDDQGLLSSLCSATSLDDVVRAQAKRRVLTGKK